MVGSDNQLWSTHHTPMGHPSRGPWRALGVVPVHGHPHRSALLLASAWWKEVLSDTSSDPVLWRSGQTPAGGAGLAWGLRSNHVAVPR